LAESPANVPGYDDRGGPGGRPDGQAILQPLIKHVAGEDKHRAVDRNVIAVMNLSDIAKMIRKRVFAVKGVEVSDLGIVVELQQERHLSIVGVLINNNSVLIAILFHGRLRRWS